MLTSRVRMATRCPTIAVRMDGDCFITPHRVERVSAAPTREIAKIEPPVAQPSSGNRVRRRAAAGWALGASSR